MFESCQCVHARQAETDYLLRWYSSVARQGKITTICHAQQLFPSDSDQLQALPVQYFYSMLP